MAVVRIHDRDYQRLQQIAVPFRDTPAIVISRLIDDYLGRHEMTLAQEHEAQGTAEEVGYLLLGEENWLRFHELNSVSETAFYCRGVGAPMHNVPIGGVIFCAQTREVPHRVHLWGEFGGWQVLSLDEAWEKYGQRLGAQDERAWRALVGRVPSIAHRGQIGLIRLDDVHVPRQPVNLAPLEIALRRGSIKGRRLSAVEVAAILDTERAN